MDGSRFQTRTPWFRMGALVALIVVSNASAADPGESILACPEMRPSEQECHLEDGWKICGQPADGPVRWTRLTTASAAYYGTLLRCEGEVAGTPIVAERALANARCRVSEDRSRFRCDSVPDLVCAGESPPRLVLEVGFRTAPFERRCEVYDDRIVLLTLDPDGAERRDLKERESPLAGTTGSELGSMIEAVGAEEYRVIGVHATAQNPPVRRYACLRGRGVLIREDSAGIYGRTGEAADRLDETIRQLCD